MSVLPVKYFNIAPSETPLGCILRWGYYFKIASCNLWNQNHNKWNLLHRKWNEPSKFMRLYLFRRIGETITEDDINDYFTGLPGNTLVDIWEMRPDIDGIIKRKKLDNKRISHGNQVYYALVIRDMDTGDISEMVTNNITIN